MSRSPQGRQGGSLVRHHAPPAKADADGRSCGRFEEMFLRTGDHIPAAAQVKVDATCRYAVTFID
jgi:hypothetical protein